VNTVAVPVPSRRKPPPAERVGVRAEEEATVGSGLDAPSLDVVPIPTILGAISYGVDRSPVFRIRSRG